MTWVVVRIILRSFFSLSPPPPLLKSLDLEVLTLWFFRTLANSLDGLSILLSLTWNFIHPPLPSRRFSTISLLYHTSPSHLYKFLSTSALTFFYIPSNTRSTYIPFWHIYTVFVGFSRDPHNNPSKLSLTHPLLPFSLELNHVLFLGFWVKVVSYILWTIFCCMPVEDLQYGFGNKFPCDIYLVYNPARSLGTWKMMKWSNLNLTKSS